MTAARGHEAGKKWVEWVNLACRQCSWSRRVTRGRVDPCAFAHRRRYPGHVITENGVAR